MLHAGKTNYVGVFFSALSFSLFIEESITLEGWKQKEKWNIQLNDRYVDFAHGMLFFVT